MRRITWLAAAVLVAALAAAAWKGHEAAAVAVGYSAKQLCSGVFVAGLPADFVIDRDIHPRMALLGPALPLLELDVDAGRAEARARLPFAEAVAGVQSPATGCSLHRRGSGARPAALPEPGEVPRALPAVSAAALDAAFAEPPGGGRNTLAVIASRGGAVVAERYAPPVTAATRLQGWSMNKSLLATWVALRGEAAEGLDLGTRVRERLDALGAPGDLTAALDPGLTLGHLLQMESGLAFDERYGPGSDATDMLFRRKAMWQAAPASGQAVAPGTRFSYSSGDTNLAAYLWQRSLPLDDYARWVDTRFSRPLGISSLVPEADASGIQVGSSYSYMTARDWLRAGQLWLDAWHGRSPLLTRSWLRDAVSPRPSDRHGHYGRGFWLNTGGMAFADAPESLFYASGNAGQYVIVVPEREVVLVRLGLTADGVATGVPQLLAAVLATGGTP